MPHSGPMSPPARAVTRTRSDRVGPPRLDKYLRLLQRFYEVYMILIIYDPFRGDHTPKQKDVSRQGVRRQFRDDLAFLCEYDKGGDACTSIGIEDRRDNFVYHVAANVDPAKKIMPFLKSLLEKLHDMGDLSDSERRKERENLTGWCIEHARSKLKKLRGMLLGYIKICDRRLEQYGSASDKGLILWLGQFKDAATDGVGTLCRLAFNERKSNSMKQFERMSQDPTYSGAPFALARHYIGRLADHIRVPHRLIDGLSEMQDLISFFDVEAIPVCAAVRIPQADNLTTIDSICGRMFSPKDHPKLPLLRAALGKHDDLLDKLTAIFEKAKPRVHAEVLVAEHFFGRNLIWADDDRYIGVSKPSCYGCHLYFKHHPAGLEERESHMKAYCNWGPPLLADGKNDERYPHQLGILNKMVADMRNDLQRQVLEPRPKNQWHADSHTAITSTVPDVEHDLMQTLARDLESLDIALSDISEHEASDSSDKETPGLSASTPELKFPEIVIAQRSVGTEDSGDDVDFNSGGGASL